MIIVELARDPSEERSPLKPCFLRKNLCLPDMHGEEYLREDSEDPLRLQLLVYSCVSKLIRVYESHQPPISSIVLETHDPNVK